MSKKATIYLSDTISELVSARVASHGSLSERVNESLAWLDYVRRSHTPQFTRPEWCAILDANNGGPFPGSDPESIQSCFWANVEDSIGLDEKWSVDSADIVRRMQELSPAETIAMAEISRYFWDFCDTDTDKLFAELGIA